VGSYPTSVAVGDFNGDRKLDLAVTNQQGSTVAVLLGNGDGTFQPAANYAVGAGPTSVAVGDFNRDGKLDLAIAILYEGTAAVLLGNGDGTFQPPVNYACYNPYSITVGDFNGDGKLDLAVANYVGNTVSVLLGNGDGTFQAAVNYPAGGGSSRQCCDPFWVTVGDFNGDGKPDLAVANNSSNDVSVLLGSGDGTFQEQVRYAVGPDPGFVTVGDFNGDGELDLVANGGSSDVSVLLGNGDGTFQSAVNYLTGGAPSSVTVGDFNGDGKPDLVVTNSGDGTVSVLLNTTKRKTGTTITALSPNPSVAGQPVTVSFTVTPVGAGFGGAPTGNVTVSDGAGDFCTATVGTGSCAISLPTAGTKTLTASYPGDTNFNSSTSAGVTQSVWDFSISASPTSQTIKAGQKKIYTITLTPLGGFTGSVALSCRGVPPSSTCFLFQNSIALSGSSSATAYAVLSTSAKTTKATYTLTFTGIFGLGVPAAGGLTHSANASLTVN
jgi:Big-like domain-containing protein/VCBS repeat protein